MADMNIMAAVGVAVREFPLATGEAASKFNVSAEEVTEAQLDEIEAEQVRAALLPFHNAQLREILLRPEHQVIDKFTRDALVAPPALIPKPNSEPKHWSPVFVVQL